MLVNAIFTILGMLLAYLAVLVAKKGHKIFCDIKNKRKSRLITQPESQSTTREEIDRINEEIARIHEDIKHLSELNEETQRNYILAAPNEFTQEKDENGKTVFVKNGKEKVYDTIDWRNR